MATIKIKFRPSTIDGEQGSIFYQVIHHRVVRRQKTSYRLYGYEWNSRLSEVILPKFNEKRKRYLSDIGSNIQADIKLFHKIISDFEHSGVDYTADDVIAEFVTYPPTNRLFSFMEGIIANLRTLGKVRTSETYATTLCSFKRFREDKDLALDNIDSDMMMAYEAYLRNNGLSPNSSSFYMRNLRAVYNRAVEKELTSQRFPFKHVYTGMTYLSVELHQSTAFYQNLMRDILQSVLQFSDITYYCTFCKCKDSMFFYKRCVFL